MSSNTPDFQIAEEEGLGQSDVGVPTAWDLTHAEIEPWEPPAKMMCRLSCVTLSVRLVPLSGATETATSHLCPIRRLQR